MGVCLRNCGSRQKTGVVVGNWNENEFLDLVCAAWPYRNLTRGEFDQVVTMLAEGFSTKRGRRSALIHHDAINDRLRGRRGARLTALTSGGAIPDNADYRVILEPSETFVGTVNEDLAVESLAGDIFQLGNASWRILRVNSGVVRVEDAKGQPPGIPFWIGEAPARTSELSEAVCNLRMEIEKRLSVGEADSFPPRIEEWVSKEFQLPQNAAEQVAAYFADAYRSLGAIPSQHTLVLERFFDESGGMQLVLHAPFGSRINKAWTLALRKRFCRQFNFELQAAATEDALLLSLGPQHSFPLSDVFRYLHPASTRDSLVAVLTRIHAGELRCLARDTPEPSAFAHEILNAKPYAFMDDAPLEERRTQAVQTRTASNRAGSEMRVLDAAAIARVRDEERPDPRDADELHDALVTAGFLLDSEIPISTTELTGARRATLAAGAGTGAGLKNPPYSVLVAAESLPGLLAIHPDAVLDPAIVPPPAPPGPPRGAAIDGFRIGED